MAWVLACGLASPVIASISAPPGGADNVLCAWQSAATGRCRGGAMLASADDMLGIGLGARPIAGYAQSARLAAHAAGATVARHRSSEIASVLVTYPAARASGDSTVPVLFWVFGSGLLGVAFVARRRKPARSKSKRKSKS